IHLGASGAFALNALTFRLSLVLTLTVHGNFQQDRATVRTAPTDQAAGIFAGLAFLWQETALRPFAIAWFAFVPRVGMSMVPDALRSRTMAGFDAVLSCGLAIAYLLAGPVRRAVGPRPVYRIGGLTALLAAITLSPLIRLRHEPEVEPEVEPVGASPFPTAEPMEPVGVLSATSDRPSV